MALLSGFGSLNAFTVSKDSQSRRLLTYAEQYGLLKNGKIVAVENGIVIPDSVLVEMSSITHYLIVSHGLDVMKNLLAINLDSLNDKSSRYDLPRKVMSQLNLKYINGNEWGMDQVKFFNLSCNDEVNPLNVEGFSFYKSFNYYSGNRDFEQELRIDSLKILHLAYEENKHVLSCRINDEKSISFRMDPFVEKLFSEYSTSNHSILEKDMTIYFENDKFKCKVLFSSIAGNYRSEKNIEKLNSMEMKVLYVGK
ncbi:MAG: hypothetical protein IPK10_00965 [Bacteroidetes bacterium]|nr:hypothetical protein [Bacteroidota bacterium]